MELEQYLPRPALVTKTTPIDRPRFPVIDCHNHLSDTFGGDLIDWVKRPLPELLDLLRAMRPARICRPGWHVG